MTVVTATPKFSPSCLKTNSSPTPGADPEIFVRNGKGRIMPAYTFLPDKKNPLKFKVLSGATGDGVAHAYYDGFQAEFTTPTLSCHGWFGDQIFSGLYAVLMAARKVDPAAKLTIDNTPLFAPSTMAKAADEHVALGCDPSFNAYGLQGKPIMDLRKMRYRFAGGHIHMGLRLEKNPENPYSENPYFSPYQLDWLKTHGTKQEIATELVKAMDAIVGVYMVGVAASFDKKKRREYYGLAGEYRLPKHGVEYRVLSNFWLAHPSFVHLIMGLTRAVWWAYECGAMKYWVAEPAEVIHTINECDVVSARKIIERNREMLAYLAGIGTQNTATQGNIAVDMGLNGAEYFLKDPTAVGTNWRIGDGYEEDILKGNGGTYAKGTHPVHQWQTHCNMGRGNWSMATAAFLKGEKKPIE